MKSIESLAIPAGLLSAGLDSAFIAKFSLFVAILLLWTVFWGKLLKRVVHLPTIAGQIVGGILLGPSLVNIAQLPFFEAPLKLVDCATNQVYLLASSDLFIFLILMVSSALTVSYLLWIAGHETDVHDIAKIGTTAVGAGLLGALVPIAMTMGIAYYGLGADWTLIRSLGLGLVFAATSVSIPVAMLFTYNKMHLRSSKATLGAAVVDDIFAVILLSMFFIIIQTGTFGCVEPLIQSHGDTLINSLISMILSFIVLIGAGYYIIPTIVRRLRLQHYSHLITPVATSIMLIYFSFAELVGGLAGITGAYFAGLFHRMGDKQHQAERIISPFVQSVLLPIFLGSIGLQINIRVLDGWDWIVVLILLIIAILSKLLGCFLATSIHNVFARSEKWSTLESFLFGSSMVARGEVGLVVATILYSSRILLPHQYVIAVVVIVLTTIAAPILLAIGFARLESTKRARDIFSLNIGLFKVIGTERLFNIIIDRLEETGQFNTTVEFSEGRKVVHLEGQHVEIILCPEEGILFKGDHANIERILRIVKDAIGQEVERISIAR